MNEWKTVKTLALALAIGGLIGCDGANTSEQPLKTDSAKEMDAHDDHSEHAHFACPMDCEDGKLYDNPSQCPECKMDLVTVSEEEVHSEKTEDHDHEHSFACPMHPEVTGQEGDKCSKCGMDLEEVKE